MWGVGGSWYRRPEPADSELVAPLDGFATTAKLQQQHAVNFIIDTVKKYPKEVTLLVIGPVTNIALAIRMNPEIVPLIKRIVYMGGAFEVPGNTTPAAEMNVWYDAEAARAVIRQPIDQAFIPLDVTNTVPMNKADLRPDHAQSRLDRDEAADELRLRADGSAESQGHVLHLRHARAGVSRRSDVRDRRRRDVGRCRHHLGPELRPHARLSRRTRRRRPATCRSARWSGGSTTIASSSSISIC